jgi:hypothetical protein
VLSRLSQLHPTVFHEVFQDDDIGKDLVNWVLLKQRRDGTFPGSFGNFMNQPAKVFNNGLIIHSLLDYYNASGGLDLIETCLASADWLLKVQSPDGSWRQFTFHQLSSNTLTASALIRLSSITGFEKYKIAGIRNIEFALELQLENGYFKGNGFDSRSSAYTMTIAYAIAGMLEAGILENNDTWKNSAMKALVPLLNKVGNNGFLPGEFDEDYQSTVSYACLPGNSLLAICAYKLAAITGNKDLRNKADLLTNYLKDKQLESHNPALAGGITGSHPISGAYCSYEITSWGVRYFTEAVLLQELEHK